MPAVRRRRAPDAAGALRWLRSRGDLTTLATSEDLTPAEARAAPYPIPDDWPARTQSERHRLRTMAAFDDLPLPLRHAIEGALTQIRPDAVASMLAQAEMVGGRGQAIRQLVAAIREIDQQEVRSRGPEDWLPDRDMSPHVLAQATMMGFEPDIRRARKRR